MKKITTLILLLVSAYSFGQLSPGDIAFIQYNADGTDNFSFVCLTDIPANEVIYFTDNEENDLTGGEGTITWTAPSTGVACGTIITITTSPSASVGITSETNDLNFAASGDGLLAYQGTTASPTFITALGNDGSTGGVFSGSKEGNLPTGLTLGVNAQSINEIDNAVYNGSVLNDSKANILADIYDFNNWSGSNTTNQTFSGTFTVSDCSSAPCVEPTTDGVFHANSPQNISTDSVTLNWTNGDGANRIVIVSENSPVSFIPTDNTTYASNANYSSSTAVAANEYIVYNGSANTVDVTGLTPGTLYYTTIYEYGCTPGTEDYYTAGSPTTDSFYTEPENPTNFSEICVNDGGLDLSWTAPSNGNFDNYLLVVRENAAPHSVQTTNPSTIAGENLDYTLASTFGSTAELSRYLYHGTNTNATVTGLTNGISYTFELFCYATNGTLFEYSTGTTVSQAIENQNVSSPSASASDAQATISWVNINSSCFDEVIVVANETSGMDFTPSGNGSGYSANTTYTTVNQVVYQNTGNNITITGLTNGTTYYFEIFVRNGTTWSSGVEVSITPSNTTIFKPGDLVFVAYDSQAASGTDDKVTILTMVDIQPGTTFWYSNATYEIGAMANERTEAWRSCSNDSNASLGTQEITYNGPDILPAGSTFCMTFDNSTINSADISVQNASGSGTYGFSNGITPAGFSQSVNISTSKPDAVFLMQGSWSADLGDYRLFNGTVLGGIQEGALWHEFSDDLSGNLSETNKRTSRIPPEIECFAIQTGSSPGSSYAYYNGAQTGSQVDILSDIIDFTNEWVVGSGSTTDEISSNTCVSSFTFTISGAATPGIWTNASNDNNWFNCQNWENLAVPDQDVDVVIPNLGGSNEAIIDDNAPSAINYNQIAACDNLTINGENVTLSSDINDKLEVYGNVNINGGVLNMSDSDNNTDDGQLYVYGNWTNTSETNFIEGNSTIHFLDNGIQQLINCNANADTEIFYNLVLDNDFTSDDFGTNIHANNNVTINANRTITVKENDYFLAANILTNNGKIIVENKGSLVQTTPGADNNSGSDYEIKKTTPEYVEYDFTYWSSPINSAEIATVFAANEPSRIFDFTTANFADVSPTNTYDDNNDDWNNPTETNMTVGKGYIVMGEGSEWPFVNNGFATNLTQSVSFDGKINNGDITYPVTLDANNTDAFTNDNLIGNPYPSAIDGEQFIIDNANLTGTLYFWTHHTPIANTGTPDPDDDAFNFTNDDYATFTTAGYAASASGATVPSDKLIASCQAFFAPINTAGTVTFNNNTRTIGSNDNFRTHNRAWFNLTNTNGLFRQILIGFFNDGTDNEDRLYDGKRMFNGTNYDFFSILNNERYAIQGFGPFVEEKIVPIGIHNLENGAFTISIDRTEGILDHKNIYLKDNLLNIYHDLKLADYTFTSNQIGEINNRFEIHFRTSALTTSEFIATNDQLVVSNQANGQVLVTMLDGSIITNVKIFDTLGKLILNININANRLDINYNLKQGQVVFIKTTLANGQIINKKFIKN